MLNPHKHLPTGPLRLVEALAGAFPDPQIVLVARPPLGLVLRLINQSTPHRIKLVVDSTACGAGGQSPKLIALRLSTDDQQTAYWDTLASALESSSEDRRARVTTELANTATLPSGAALVVNGSLRYAEALMTSFWGQWGTGSDICVVFSNGWVEDVRRAAYDLAYLNHAKIYAGPRVIVVYRGAALPQGLLADFPVEEVEPLSAPTWTRIPVRLEESPISTLGMESSPPAGGAIAGNDPTEFALPPCIAVGQLDSEASLMRMAGNDALESSFASPTWTVREHHDLLVSRTDEFFFSGADGVLLHSCYFNRPGPQHDFVSPYRRPLQTIPGTSFLALGQGHKNYFHWIVEHLPKVLLWKQAFGSSSDVKLVIPDGDLYRKTASALLECNVDEPSIQTIRLKQGYRFEKAIYTSRIITDRGLRPSRIIGKSHELLSQWATRMAPAGQAAGDSPRKIYVSRLDAWRRKLINEDELIEQLQRRGFHIFTAAGLSVDQQAATFRNAEFVLGPHGAGFTNILFSGRLRRVLEIFGGTYFNPCFRSLAAAISNRIDWTYYCGSRANDDYSRINKHDYSFTVDIADLMKIVDSYD